MLPFLAGIIFAQALIEEKQVLEKRFGVAYAAYQKRTAMLVPRITKAQNPLRTTVSFLAVYAGLLGSLHGNVEILQGNTAPDGPMFNVIGPPCQPEMVWHACLPAMSLIPNLLVTGIAAVIVSLVLLIWALFFVRRRRGGLVLMAAWFLGSWLLGASLGDVMLAASGLLFLVFDAGLPVLAALSGYAREKRSGG